MKLGLYLATIVSALLLSSCSDSNRKEGYVPASKKMNLETLKFAVHPYLNSKQMYIYYRPILDLIEAKLGNIDIVLETSATYAEYNIKLYRGDFDISLPNPFQTYNSLSKGYKVIARMKPDSVFRGIFVVRKDSNISNINQLKGRNVSFPAPTALAATMMPLLYLHEHGLNVKKDIVKKYVGSQYSSILNVFSSDTIAGATWPPPWELWKRENIDKAKQMEVVWQTDSLINNGVVVKKDMDEELVNKILDVLVNLDSTPKGKNLLSNAGFDGFIESKNRDYDIVAGFLKKYNKAIGTPR